LRPRAYAVRALAATTVTDIAEPAGVGRVTVSRHLPDETALAWACSGRYLERRTVGVLAAPFRARGERRPAASSAER
jgi:AcrR family transcriptional regulator